MSIDQRKADHIRINVTENVQFPNLTTGWSTTGLFIRRCPKADLGDVCLEVALFGKRVHAPLLISSMTGGTADAQRINRNLAEAAQSAAGGHGVGSQRAGIE
jgi:isopentenyl-diphosphate delta-isomerase